jgi:hypothetical protein
MKKRIWVITIFVIIGLIAAFGAILKKHTGIRCDFDGTRIQPIYEVKFTFEDNTTEQFCSVVCALLHLKNEKKKLKYITVVDEVSGNKIDASLAFFVESDVLTIPHVKNNIHVFAKKEGAQRHATQFNGKFIPNPFR